MANHISIHGIKAIKASASSATDGLILDLSDQWHWHADSQIVLYADDAILSERLAVAINKVVKDRADEIEAAKQPETEAA